MVVGHVFGNLGYARNNLLFFLKVFLVNLLQLLEMLLPPLVHGLGGIAELFPNFFPMFLGNGTNVFLPYFMKGLQFAEGLVQVRFIGQCFGTFHQFLLLFKIVFKIKVTQFSVEVQEIVKDFHVMVVSAPYIIVIGPWNRPCIFPAVLQVFEIIVSGVDIFLNVDEPFEFLYDFQPFLQVGF